jgi:hypothetical protein
LVSLLPEVAEFIRQIHGKRPHSKSPRPDGVWWSRRDEGFLVFDADQTRAYRSVVQRLLKRHVPNDDLSVKSVESFLQDAVFSALDLPKRSTDTFEDRLKQALERLLSLLKAPSQRFTCWISIDGLAVGKRSAQFAGIRFVKFGRQQLRVMARRTSRIARQHPAWKVSVGGMKREPTWNRPCAVVSVDARDFASAEALARRRTRQILDVLNLFTDLVPYNNGWLYLHGETTQARQIVPTQRSDGVFTANHTRLAPYHDVSWKSFRSAKHLASPLRTLDQLASKSDYGAELLFSSAQWIGRATIERRREESFLLFAIALETMMSPTTEGQSVGQRLRLRVAHVLGRTLAARERIAKDVNRLYGVRSKIVHHGSYEVSDADLALLNAIVKSTLFKLLRNRRLHSMSREQIAEWFDRKLLR